MIWRRCSRIYPRQSASTTAAWLSMLTPVSAAATAKNAAHSASRSQSGCAKPTRCWVSTEAVKHNKPLAAVFLSADSADYRRLFSWWRPGKSDASSRPGGNYPVGGGNAWGGNGSPIENGGQTCRRCQSQVSKGVPLPLLPQSASPTGAKGAEEHKRRGRVTQGGARLRRRLPWAGLFRAFSASAASRPGKQARLVRPEAQFSMGDRLRAAGWVEGNGALGCLTGGALARDDVGGRSSGSASRAQVLAFAGVASWR